MPNWPPRTGSDWVIWSVVGVIGAFVVFIVIASAAAPASEEAPNATRQTPTPSLGSSTLAACEAVEDLLAEASSLTGEETLSRLESINRDASRSPFPAIREWSAQAVTLYANGSTSEAELAVNVVWQGCRQAGYD